MKVSWYFLAPFVLVSITISFLNCCSPFYTLLVSTENNKPIGFCNCQSATSPLNHLCMHCLTNKLIGKASSVD